jgi:microcystin-dependent protein
MDSNIDKRLGLKFDKSGGQIYGDLKVDGDISLGGQNIQDIIDAIVPVGSVIAFAGTSAPTNYKICDGSSLSRSEYAKLFSAIGTAHGAPDADSFNLPDYRGRFLRGVDGSAGNDPDKATRTAMATGGSTGNNVGSVQSDAFQGHWHNINRSDTLNAGGTQIANGSGSVSADTYVKNPVTDGVNGVPRTSSETRPKNAYVNYIIKYQ